jgi:hypothetical protein
MNDKYLPKELPTLIIPSPDPNAIRPPLLEFIHTPIERPSDDMQKRIEITLQATHRYQCKFDFQYHDGPSREHLRENARRELAYTTFKPQIDALRALIPILREMEITYLNATADRFVPGTGPVSPSRPPVIDPRNRSSHPTEVIHRVLESLRGDRIHTASKEAIG